MEWIFDGIGTEIVGLLISLIIGAITGGVVVYKIGVKNTTKQVQKAHDKSKQEQIIRVNMDNNSTHKTHTKNKTTINQSQKAGNNASQSQIGGTNNVRK